MEMQAVADRFDRDGDGFIDYKEFVAALRPERGEVIHLLILKFIFSIHTLMCFLCCTCFVNISWFELTKAQFIKFLTWSGNAIYHDVS